MNKYKLLILICFFLLTISLPNVTASINNLNLLGKIIVLDAGHGGTDSGAKNGKIVEKELNLLLVKKLEKELISRGATVYLTREEDNDLSARTSERKRSEIYKHHKSQYVHINSFKCYYFIIMERSPSIL